MSRYLRRRQQTLFQLFHRQVRRRRRQQRKLDHQ
jgi:hypothetical protein